MMWEDRGGLPLGRRARMEGVSVPESGSRRRSSSDFYRLLPARSVLVFFLAIFFTFAPIGLMLVTSPAQRRPWLSILASCLVSGCLAVSWAATFTLSRWYIIGIVSFSVLMFLLSGPLAATRLGIRSGRPSLDGVGFVLAIVIGYILFIVFISGQGRTTLRLKTEMDLAGQIHDTLVPGFRATHGRYEVMAFSVASSEMGGDLVDLIRHDRGTDLVLADVSGHGVRAGVVMAMVKSAVRTGLQVPGGLGELLTRLNRLLEETTTSETYTTFAGLRLPGEGEQLEYALAGHRILHYRSAPQRIERLDGQSIPLGMVGQECPSEKVTMEPGDLLAVYTDGLNETENAAGDQLDHEPIERVIFEKAHRPLEEIQGAVFALASSHGDQTDDRSLLLVRARM